MNAFADMANPWVERLPIYEPGRPIDEVARELGFDDPNDVFKLASNENALGPSPLAMAAMRDCLPEMHRYPDGGAFHLRRALASRLRVTPEQILPTNGSNEAIELIGHVFLQPGTGIVMADMAFIVYKLVAVGARAEVITVPMKDFTHDLDAMLAAIRPDTRVVFISNPNNPTGTMVSSEDIETFMANVPEHVVVCFDEAYVELLPPERQPDTLAYVRQGRRVIVLRTFSKAYGLAGLRIGYAVAPEPCAHLLNRVRQPFNVNAMALAAALAAIEDDDHVRRTRAMVADGMKRLSDAFDGLGLRHVPSVTNFALVRVGQGRKVFEALQREGVIVRPMDGYGLPEFVRVTVGTAEENDRLTTALKRMVAGEAS
jgi:histidinol-phosphate aminotransferase